MHNLITKLSKEIHDRVTLIRHDIHKHPEIAYQETRTAGVIETFLNEIGISHKRCTKTGVVGIIGKGNGHIVGLRSEMDALEMPDRSDLSYNSVHENTAHACGHDGHSAILLGTAWVLKQLENELSGTVKFIWQPAEEGGAGAQKMIEHGVLEPPEPEAIFALHGWPSLPLGKAGYRFGPTMASVDNFEITVMGKGTHGAQPHTGVDPVVIAARIVDGIQLIRSRMINPLEPIVITVGTIHGGSATNVIPDEVTMTGTIRALNPDIRGMIPAMMERMTAETARASGGEAVFSLKDCYPATINEDRATAFVRDTLHEILGPENVVEIKTPVMGGEDFAYYLEKIPGSFFRLGVGNTPPLHSSAFDFNDDAITVGIRVMAGLAVRFMECGLT